MNDERLEQGFKMNVINKFDEFLTKKGVDLPNVEKQRDKELYANISNIYGSDYSELMDYLGDALAEYGINVGKERRLKNYISQNSSDIGYIGALYECGYSKDDIKKTLTMPEDCGGEGYSEEKANELLFDFFGSSERDR